MKNDSIVEENATDMPDSQAQLETPIESGSGSLKSLDTIPDEQRQPSIEKEITKKYDLENTIAIRKKSLESQFNKNLMKTHELTASSKRLEAGKVSQLKEKFARSTKGNVRLDVKLACVQPPVVTVKPASKITTHLKSPPDNTTDNRTTSMRLSGRVKDVTERLSSPLPTKKSPPLMHAKSGVGGNISSNFKKASEFWNR
jgi:hypothetical protein